MHKIIDDSYGKHLWEIYLESIRPDRTVDFALPSSTHSAAQASSAEALQLSPERIFGSIRMLDDGDFLILFLIIAQIKEELYTAIKVSNFTQFSTWNDLEIPGACGSYIAELDNSFTLNIAQIENSFVLDEIDAYTFIQLEGVWSAEGNRFSGKPLYWNDIGHWRAQFRIKEHEITCVYRVGNIYSPPGSLWIPQLELKGGAENRVAAAMSLDYSRLAPSMSEESDFAPLIDKNTTKRDGDVDESYFARQNRPASSMMGYRPDWYYLSSGRGGSLVIELESNLWGREARIYNGEYLVFRGILPERLELFRYESLSRCEIDAALNLRLEH